MKPGVNLAFDQQPYAAGGIDKRASTALPEATLPPAYHVEWR